jgi:hypothetical protein
MKKRMKKVYMKTSEITNNPSNMRKKVFRLGRRKIFKKNNNKQQRIVLKRNKIRNNFRRNK